jgi:hypothetical protein
MACMAPLYIALHPKTWAGDPFHRTVHVQCRSDSSELEPITHRISGGTDDAATVHVKEKIHVIVDVLQTNIE